jgi:hypothetical protein
VSSKRFLQWMPLAHLAGQDGCYLDDATQYERLYADVCQIPKELDRKTLGAGDLARLSFRFADEWSPGKDNECERMWLEVLAADEYNLNHQGQLLNAPHLHSAIVEGRELWFHPLHVFDPERAEDQIV